MITVFPSPPATKFKCSCGGVLQLINNNLLWQGPHICIDVKCVNCGSEFYIDLPVGQGKVTPFVYNKYLHNVLGDNQTHWYAKLMTAFDNPVLKDVRVDVEKRKNKKQVLILNTIDFCYGHSLLFLFNLNNILDQLNGLGLVVIIQPMFRWLIPADDRITEVWTVHLSLSEGYNFYPVLSEKLNKEIQRFYRAYLSTAHLLPHEVDITKFTRVKPFEFGITDFTPRITFIWREDAGRLWIKDRYTNFAIKKIGASAILRGIQMLRVKYFFFSLRKRLGNHYRFSIAGLGTYGRFSSFIEDVRVNKFDDENEKRTCQVYAESLLVIGIHGSSMILPSAHAGMALSIMPAKRWGNYLEDLLVSEQDSRLAIFQKRVLPMRLKMSELVDISVDMIKGRQMFSKKFLYSKEEL
ncbi:MAG: hypothetical protein WKF85_01185 [Chitinophagaceae bacterium]